MWRLFRRSSKERPPKVQVFVLNILVCASLWTSGCEAISKECQEYLQFVASSSSQFQVCAFLKARPFTVCTGCSTEYAFAYNAIINLKTGRGLVEKNCSETLLSGDRVSIVNRAFEYLSGTWGSGNCNNCLVVTKKDDELSFEVSNTTKTFLQRSKKLENCIDLHLRNQTEVCHSCSEDFHHLSEFYRELVTPAKNKVCMDILDTMNQTRVDWAKYGCLPVYGLGPPMYLLSVTMLAMTVGFYVLARLSQKPRDARVIEGRTLRHHVSRMSINSDFFRLSGRSQPMQAIAS